MSDYAFTRSKGSWFDLLRSTWCYSSPNGIKGAKEQGSKGSRDQGIMVRPAPLNLVLQLTNRDQRERDQRINKDKKKVRAEKYRKKLQNK